MTMTLLLFRFGVGVKKWLEAKIFGKMLRDERTSPTTAKAKLLQAELTVSGEFE